MSSFLKLHELLEDRRSHVSPKIHGMVVYGGTFDPCHLGHLGVVRDLDTVFTKVLIAPTSRNPWKTKFAEPAPVEVRREMLSIMLRVNSLEEKFERSSSGISICKFDYIYVDQLLVELRNTTELPLYWAVGEDIVDGITSWRNYSSMQLKVVVVPIVVPIHAIDIRLGLRPIHPALEEVCAKHQLYGY